MIQPLTRYVRTHWRGEQGLAWSFWINFVAIRVLVTVVQEWLGPQEGTDYHTQRMTVLVIAALVHGGLFTWQAVGLVRASETYIRGGGSMAKVWGTQIALVIGLSWTLTYVLDAWQMTVPLPTDIKTQADLRAERAEKYHFEMRDEDRTLSVSGSLELGITKAFKAELIAHPDVVQVILNSTGGNIYEARGMSQTIRQNGLKTRVDAICASACTTAFIGGLQRTLGPDGKLGFHQYRIDADYTVLIADPSREQDKDRAIFEQSGVAPWFLEKMFESSASDMWFPEIRELIRANVVTTAN